MATKRDAALVSQFIEKISGDILDDRYRLQLAALIRGHAGLYALYRGDALYYVGLATDLMRRVDRHSRDHHAGEWNRFSVYLTERDEHLKPLESLLLRVFRPPGNGQTGRLPGAEDRKRALEAAMRAIDEAGRKARLYDGDAPRKRAQAKRVAVAHPRATSKGALRKRTASSNGFDRAMRLQADYKGQRYRAVLNKDRSVRYAGQRYASLSAAAVAITGSATNGWNFWRFCNDSGEWRPLSDLR
jgi:hypothetical protein